MLAKYFGGRKGGNLTFKEMLIGSAIFGGPVLLVLLEPDAGQAITYFPILAAVIFLSGIKIRYVVLAVVAAAIMIPVAWTIGVKTGKDQALSAGEDPGDNRSGKCRSADMVIIRIQSGRSRSVRANSRESRAILTHHRVS